MDANIRKELFDWHCANDSLFRRLVTETETEPDDKRFAINVALLELVLDGKVRIMQDNFGTLLFEKTLPN